MNKFKRDIEDDEIRIIYSDHDVDLDSEPTKADEGEDMFIGAADPSKPRHLSLKSKICSEAFEDEEFSSLPDVCGDEIHESYMPSATAISAKSKIIRWFIIALCIVVVAGLAWIVIDAFMQDSEDPVVVHENPEVIDGDSDQSGGVFTDSTAIKLRGFAQVTDTVINKVPLMIITPVNSTPRLQIGLDALNDSDAVLVVQAADVRGDNGEIVGSYVSEGQLLSRGQSKSGFCAIIGGRPIIGVAEATPFLEQAIETEGYFFRQYPLVVANQIVENKPKGHALRKALAELDGKIVVIVGRKRQTFHEFSQTLVDLGVSNAIYLVGSLAYGYAKDGDGTLIEFGTNTEKAPENTNYIIWK